MDHFDYSAFDRYLAGEATPEERARIEAWLRENPARQRGLRAFQDAQVQALQPPHGFDIERLVVGIEQYTANASAGYDTQPTVSPAVSDMTAGKGKRGTRSVLHAGRRKISAYGIAIAASVAIALFGVQSVARLWDGRSVETVREYVTQPAQRATLDLPDGSRMVLGPDSRVVYSASASQGRVLELEGQAYFTVSADPTRPFVVKTRTVTTRVLGTAFSVRAYPTDRVAQVAVAEGKVAIGRTEPSTVLLPGDVGVVEQGLEPIVRRDVQLRDVFGWMHGQLRFDGTPFREVALELERTYGLTIQVTDSTLMDRRMTGVLSNEQVADVLELVGVGIDATYTRRGSVVVFTPR